MKKEMVEAWFDIIPTLPETFVTYWQAAELYEPPRDYVEVGEILFNNGMVEEMAQRITQEIDEQIINAVRVGDEFLNGSLNPPSYGERMIPGVLSPSEICLQPDPNSELSKISGIY